MEDILGYRINKRNYIKHLKSRKGGGELERDFSMPRVSVNISK